MKSNTKIKSSPLDVNVQLDDQSNKMREMRCADPKCNHFLGYENIKLGLIQITCHECRKVSQFSNAPEEIVAPDKLLEVRCACGHFLYGEAIIQGTVRVMCHFCKRWNTLEIEP